MMSIDKARIVLDGSWIAMISGQEEDGHACPDRVKLIVVTNNLGPHIC